MSDRVRDRASMSRMGFRLDPEQKALIERAAAYSGASLTGFAVATLVTEARRVVQKHETVVLSEADRHRFLPLLDNAPTPADALRSAGRRHRDLISQSE